MTDLEYLRRIRAELEAATADLRAVTAAMDHIIEAGVAASGVDLAIIDATLADATHRADRAIAAAAVWRAAHPDADR